MRKRDRTHRLLIETAMAVFAERGVAGAAVQEIAARAGVANGTFYNYFPTKEAVMEAIADKLGVGLCERIEASCAGVPEGAERMAIGNRRYIGLAIEQPDQARLMHALLAAAPSLLSRLDRYVDADLRLGEKQGAFKIRHRRTALDMIQGTVTMAMHRAVSGKVPRSYASDVATLVLRGLGVPPQEAEAIARRPLPPLPPETG